MAAPPPFTDKEQAFLSALLDEQVEFLIVGLAAAALQGAPAVTQDIDLWFANLADPKLHQALTRVGATYVPPSASHPPLLVGGGAELFDVVVHMHGLGTYEQERQNAVEVHLGDLTIPVLPLARIIESKKATDRPKDRAILPALEDALRVALRENEEDC